MEHMSASMALASVTASTVSSSSSTSSAAPRRAPAASQNWRGKYLRALNISTPEVDVTRKRAAGGGSSSSSTTTATQQQQQPLMRRPRSCRTMNASRDVSDSAMRTTRSRRQLLLPRPSGGGYGFAVRPDLARGRRCHTDPVVAPDEKVSAPIQIPSAPALSASPFAGAAKLSDITNLGKCATASEKHRRRYGHRSPGENLSSQQSKLLSWEDPVAMIGAAPTAQKQTTGLRLGGLDIAFSQLHVGDRVGGPASSGHFFCDEFVEDPEDDDEAERSDSDDDDGDDDQIFEMEDFENSSSNNNSDDGESRPRAKGSRSRRLRTASVTLSTISSPSSRAAALPRFHSVRHMRCPPRDATALPESFVPPHELVQRDVFSIGLRDKFKRRPAKI